jgi:PKD repeat protein
MVRGSVGRVIVLNDGITIVLNEEGEWLAYAQGQTVDIPAGWQVTITPGSPPSELTPQGSPPQNQPVNNQDGGDPSYPASLKAGFSASTTQGAIPLAVQFTDESTGNVTNWSWDFGDGTSTDANPVHTYSAPGIYTVSLTVTGPEGSDTLVKNNYILALNALPGVDFSASTTLGAAPLSVEFTGTSEGAISAWEWAFGDGGISYEENPAHVYTTPGTFTVSLTVTYAEGTETVTKYDYISVWNGWTQSTDDDFDSGALNNLIIFSDEVIPIPVYANGDGGDSPTPITAAAANDGMLILSIDNASVEPDWTPSTPSNDMWFQIYGTNYAAQVITPGINGIPVEFVLRLGKNGSPDYPLVVELRECDITGAPGDAVLCTSYLTEIPFTGYCNVYFPPFTVLQEGVSYALVLHQMNDQGNAQNCYEWEWNTDYFYSGGCAWGSPDSTVSWTEIEWEGSPDFYFESSLGQYHPFGQYESSSHDCGIGKTFGPLVWDATVPAGTELKFQIATNNDNETWIFVGPDGTNDTYYEANGTAIWTGHNGDRYIRYVAFFDLADGIITPQLRSFSILFH